MSGAQFQKLSLAIVTSCALICLPGCGGAASSEAKHLARGKAFFATGKLEKARVEFRNALQVAPNDAVARYENGIVDEKMGNLRDAARFFQGAIDINPDYVLARAKLGRMYVLSGVPEEALKTIGPSFENHPQDPDLLAVRAVALIQLQDAAGGLHAAEQAVALAPANEDAVAVLSGIYASMGDNGRARELLERSVNKVPDSVDLRLALAHLYASSGQPALEEPLLLDLVRIQPAEHAHRLRLAQYYASQNQLDLAEKTLRQSIKDLPDERATKTDLIQFLAARRSREVAEKQLQAFVAAQPRDYELKMALAEFYERGTQLDKAEAVYRGIVSAAGLEGPGLRARDRLAVLRVQQNDIPGAQKLIGEVLAKSPRDNDALILAGNLDLARKDPKAAIVDLRSVLRDQPNSSAVMRLLARAHLLNGEPALAEEIMRRALDGNPGDATVRQELADMLLRLGKAPQAKPIIDALVKEQPENLAAIDVQFKVAVRTLDFATAKAAADATVTLEPKAAVGYYYQGVVAEARKSPEEALGFYRVALEHQPDAEEPLNASVKLLVSLKRAPEALRLLDDLAVQSPKRAALPNMKGDLLVREKRAAEAEAAYRQAISLAPKWWVPYAGLAGAQLANKRDPAVAVATLREAKLVAEDRDTVVAELASLLVRSGRVDEAIGEYEEALKLKPEAEFAANNLAMMLVTYRTDAASIDRAKQVASRFANSDNPSLLDTFGWVLYKHGDAAAAVKVLSRVVAQLPNDPAERYHLGMALALAGDVAAARDNLGRAVRSGVRFDGYEEAARTLGKLAPPAG